jgi:hypothetical protein
MTISTIKSAFVEPTTAATSLSNTDTLDAQGFNDSYWSDAQSPAVTVTRPAPVAHAEVSVPAAASRELVPPTNINPGQGVSVKFAAFEISGPDVKSWMQFDPTTGQLSGTVPADMAGKVELAVIVTFPKDVGGIDLISVNFVPGVDHTAPTPMIGMAGMPALYSPPEPGHMLAFHA